MMDKELLERLAREAGFDEVFDAEDGTDRQVVIASVYHADAGVTVSVDVGDRLRRFAALVAEEVRLHQRDRAA